MPRLLGIFDHPDKTAAAITQIRGRGYSDVLTYAPAPFTDVEDAVDPKPSGVRLYTLIGGLVGVCTGYALTLWMANDWKVVIGGKPFSSIPPYTIIAFELTILFGGLMSAIGLFRHAKLGRIIKDDVYHPRFSAEDFGVVVTCQPRDVTELESLLRSHGALEVTLVES